VKAELLLHGQRLLPGALANGVERDELLADGVALLLWVEGWANGSDRWARWSKEGVGSERVLAFPFGSTRETL
jgi:hypothetical protein